MTRPDPTPPRLPHRVEILLVEDHPGDVRLVIEALREEKISNDVRVVSDGASALAYLRKEPPYDEAARPDLVLLDLHLPRMGGLELLAAMKADPALASIPVVVVTSSRSDADARRALELGAAGFVTKPFEFRQLAACIQSTTELWIAIVCTAPPPPAQPRVAVRAR